MRVLGIVPSSTDVKRALLEGTRANPVLRKLPSTRQKLPVDASPGRALLSFRRLLSTFLSDQGVERICILQAGRPKVGGPSATRVKAEAIIQLVGAEREIPVMLVTPQSLRAQEKHFPELASGTPETVLNGGVAFKPRAWRDAVLVAWCGFDE